MSDSSTATLTCPKCQGAMRSYERNGVTIDQCQECRGVFLDRGELDRLIDAEEQRYATPPAPDRRPDRDDDRRSDRDDSDHGSRYGGKRKRGGFLGELFE